MKIVFLEPLGFSVETVEQAVRPLLALGHDVTVFPDKRPECNIERAADADIIVQSDVPMDQHFFQNCPKLKMLAIAIVGLDHIDMEYCDEHDVVVTNAAGYSTEAVAELTIGMMLALYRKLVENDRVTRLCSSQAILSGRELKGKTVGLLGMGSIGRRVAELLRAFGCRILAWNRSPISVDGVKFVDKETLLRESDIVSVHLALTEATVNFLTYSDLRKMKRSAVIINTARGSIVNNADLARALDEEVIAGAALDVYADEPPLFYGLPVMKPDNPLLSSPHTLLLPHIGFGTVETQQLRLKIVLQNIEQYLSTRVTC